jgi:hypothetical protein
MSKASLKFQWESLGNAMTVFDCFRADLVYCAKFNISLDATYAQLKLYVSLLRRGLCLGFSPPLS